MPIIGHVTADPRGGFTGELRTLLVSAPLEILPVIRNGNDPRPDYRVTSDGFELGAGWNRRSESKGHDYVSLSLATPEFGPRRIYVTLDRESGSTNGDFALVWIPAD